MKPNRDVDFGTALVVIALAVIVSSAFAASCAEAGNLTITTPSGTTIERVEAADAEAVTEAAGRADFMRAYALALTAPTVTSTCEPKVLDVNGQEIIVMSCGHSFFDPTRLKVPDKFMTRPTRWVDVFNSLVGGTRDVALGLVGAAPYGVAAYAINQVRKGSGNNREYNDSFNDNSTDPDNSNHSNNSDNRSGTAEGGSLVGDGRLGDDSTSTPTVVPTPDPVIVPSPDPVIVPAPDPVIVTQPAPIIFDGSGGP